MNATWSPLGADARMTEPTSGLIENFPDGIFDAARAQRTRGRRRSFSGSRVSQLNVLEHFARRAAAERNAAEGSQH